MTALIERAAAYVVLDSAEATQGPTAGGRSGGAAPR